MRDRPNAVMVFAAGRGTRMAPLTDHVPKPLIPVGGKPLIDHALSLTRDAGLSKVVVNTSYLAEKLEDHLKGRAVSLIREVPGPLETGGGLKNALHLLGSGPVMTLNSDAVWTGANPLQELLAAWDPATMDALVLLGEKTRSLGHRGKGDFLADTDGRLHRGPGDIYLGAQITRTAILDEIRETTFSFNQVWDMQIARGRLFGIRHDGYWCDVGHPQGIAEAEEMLRNFKDV